MQAYSSSNVRCKRMIFGLAFFLAFFSGKQLPLNLYIYICASLNVIHMRIRIGASRNALNSNPR